MFESIHSISLKAKAGSFLEVFLTPKECEWGVQAELWLSQPWRGAQDPWRCWQPLGTALPVAPLAQIHPSATLQLPANCPCWRCLGLHLLHEVQWVSALRHGLCIPGIPGSQLLQPCHCSTPWVPSLPFPELILQLMESSESLRQSLSYLWVLPFPEVTPCLWNLGSTADFFPVENPQPIIVSFLWTINTSLPLPQEMY